MSLGFGLVFFVAATTFGATIAQSVVEEKQTRVVEILMSAIPVRALLAGKVLGNSDPRVRADPGDRRDRRSIGLTVTGQDELLAGLGPRSSGSWCSSLLGFILLAALFAAAGIAGLTSGGHRFDDDPDHDADHDPVLRRHLLQRQPGGADDHVVRAVLGAGRACRCGCSSARRSGGSRCCRLLILLAPRVAVILSASRIYENSLLRMGGRVKLSEALKA